MPPSGARARARQVPFLSAFAAAVAVLALVAALSELRPRLEDARDALTAASRSPTERELAPATSRVIPPELFLRAREVVPRDAVYSVVVGDTPATPVLWHLALPGLLAYWLLPRRYTPDVREADWVITFRESAENLGVPVAREIGLGPDGNAVEVRR